MDYRTHILKMIDKFNIESVEEFKEAEMRIIRDSKFTSIMKKKDYGGHIEMLKKVKNKAQRINPKAVVIPEEDVRTRELEKAFEKCLMVFSSVCDSYIQMQTALKEKSEGTDLKYGQYKEINDKVKAARASLNENMHEMDILYSDFVDFAESDDGEDLGGVEYKTYDSFR